MQRHLFCLVHIVIDRRDGFRINAGNGHSDFDSAHCKAWWDAGPRFAVKMRTTQSNLQPQTLDAKRRSVSRRTCVGLWQAETFFQFH
jgi:hypothetical protein